MAKQTTNPTLRTNKPKTTSSCCFLTCFGFSEDQEVPDTMAPPDKATAADTPRGRRRKRWFSWSSRLHVKTKSAAKTVPVVDHTTLFGVPGTVDKIEAPPPPKSKSSIKPKSSKSAVGKLAGIRHIPFSSRKPPSLAPETATAAIETRKPQTKDGSAQNTVLENRGDSDTKNETTGQKRRSFRRKIDAIRTGNISQPGSPVDHNKPVSSTRRIGRAMSHPAASFPNFKPASPPARKQTGEAEKVDPVVGMTIVLVTLIIMLLWGRVCAILSTSAWFYFIPRLSKSAKSSARSHGRAGDNPVGEDPDLSYENKKRVVLEGFLNRNHR